MFTSPGTRAGRGESLGFFRKALTRMLGLPRGSVLYQGANGLTYLAPSTLGYVLQTNGAGADPTFVALGSITSGWSTVLDVDFSAQPNQTLNTDTAYSIGGYAFTKVNSTNDSTAMAVANGSGLVVTPKSTSTWASNTRTAPALEIALSTIIPNYDVSMGLRLYIEMASENPAANGDSVFFGTDNLNASAAQVVQILYFRGFLAGALGADLYTQTQQAGGGTDNISAMTIGSANRVSLLEIPLGLSTSPKTLFVGASAGSNFPVTTALNPALAAQPTTVALTTTSNPISLSGITLVLGARRNGSVTAYVATIKHIRVDVRR